MPTTQEIRRLTGVRARLERIPARGGGAFNEKLLIEGERMAARVEARLVSAKLVRPYDGATSVELEFDDADFEILRSGLLSKKGKPTGRAKKVGGFEEAPWARFGQTRLVLDGFRFRLAGVSSSFGPTQRHRLRVTFEDEVAATLRRYKRQVIGVRKNPDRWGLTRAKFVLRLCRTARIPSIGDIDIPERDDVQEVRGANAKARARLRRRGIDKDAELTVKGADATSGQIDLMEDVLAVADEERASERATLALLVACIQESAFQNLASGHADSQGILQLRTGIWGVKLARDVEGSARAFLTRGFWGKGGAIKLARDNPRETIGWIAQQVQGSAFPTLYDPWTNEAEAILAAYGGVGRVKIDRKSYEFRNRKDTPFWDTIADLAREVRFRHFATENTLHYVSDDYLIGLRPVFALSPDTPGVIGCSTEADVGLPVSEMTWEVRKPRWTGRAGIPVTVKEMGPYNGRWLIARVEEDLFEIESATLVLKRPAPALPEPAPDTDRIVQTETDPERGSLRQRILREAEKSLSTKTGHNYYSQPGELTTDPTASPPKRSDCSQWVRAIYLRAGAEDPGTWTNAQIAKGRKTKDPQPADLMFAADGGHVELYVGAGKTIGHGSPPIDRSTVSNWPGHFFVTYDFLDG